MFFSVVEETNLSLPTAIEKRDILYGAVKVSTDKLKAMGNDFLKAGWYSDAADFFGQAGDRDSIGKLSEKALEDGDTFLLLKTARLLGDADSITAALERCALRAESLGKVRYAIRAYDQLGNVEKAKALREQVAQDGDIIAEAEAAKVFIPENDN